MSGAELGLFKKVEKMTLNDLPEIQIKRNLKATKLRLRVDQKQIKVTAPFFCSNRQIQNFIKDSEDWILNAWKQQQAKLIKIDKTLPTELQFFNLIDPINIQYNSQKNNYVFEEKKKTLLISDRQPEKYLKNFVIDYAKAHLPNYLNQISSNLELPYQACNIRQPKTRWGSCSAKHDIMLNSGIVLFDQSVVRYLCVHELAHTKHFDHSVRFWSLVEKFDPEYKAHRGILKKTPMPYWWTDF